MPVPGCFVFTWRERRRGRGGPREAWDWSAADWRHATLPSLPALILWPPMMSSKNQTSGVFCQSTKPPTSARPWAAVTVWSPRWNSDAHIRTLPTAYMLRTPCSAACPPVAAMYCWMMYLAVDACCNGSFTQPDQLFSEILVWMRARVTETKRARHGRWAAYDGGVADGAAEGAVVRDGAGDERRADDVEEELELGGRGGGPVDGGAVEGLVLEPGAHVGAPGAAALVGAGGVDEHLIGDGHLQHGVQGVVAVQVRAQLPHDTAAASPRRASTPTDGAGGAELS